MIVTEPAILDGDCLDVLPTLPADRFHCVVTSPPYFALRSYLPADHTLKPKEIGSEPTPEAFVETMVRVFREVRRVLHPSGLLFLNLGDGYDCGTNKAQVGSPNTDVGNWKETAVAKTQRRHTGIGAGQLLNIPHRVAEALRQDGWLWRQTIVWSKRSPMPESVRGWRWERCRVKISSQRRFDNCEYAKAVGNPTYASGPVQSQPQAEWQPCPGCPKCEKHAAPCPLCSDATGAASDVLDDWILRQPPVGTRFPDKVARLLGYAERGEPCPMCGGRGTYGGYLLRRGKGRCTTAHEYVFVLAKSEQYFWDSAAFVEESLNAGQSRVTTEKGFAGQAAGIGIAPTGNARPGSVVHIGQHRNPRSVWQLEDEQQAVQFREWLRSRGIDLAALAEEYAHRQASEPRTTWHLSSEPTSVAHFATYPSELVRRCVQAGTSDGGCCPECGMPWAPVVDDHQRVPTRPAIAPKEWRADHYDERGQCSAHSPNRDPARHIKIGGKILDYRPTCECGGESTPCRVLDPFAGIGTTLQTAHWMRRESVGIELNPQYGAIARQQVQKPPRWWRRQNPKATGVQDAPGQMRLFT